MKKHAARALWIAGPILALGIAPWPGKPPASMEDAARAFLASLEPAQREKAALPFEAEDRTKWHFVPGPRKGLPLKEMNPPQRAAAHALLRTGLSSQGYLKATAIMSLDRVLREIEGNDSRDEELYYLAVFGAPDAAAPWGWRFEGHHLSLNFTPVTGAVVATTPLFLGANPAEVRTGPKAGLRVLAEEEDLARALLRSFDPEQRKAAVIAETAPADILLLPGRKDGLGLPQGLPGSRMNDAQKDLLGRLLCVYTTRNLPDHHGAGAVPWLVEGLDAIHFAWAGGAEPGQGHYYRLHGKSFVIEYDNTQNGANHIHTVWHDLRNDFGADLLRKHYEDSHRGK